MVQVSGKYQHERDENLLQFLQASGATQELIEMVTQPNFIIEVSDEGGRQIIIKGNFGVAVTHVLNEEVDEPMLAGAKCFAERQGDVITVTTKLPNGRSTTKVYNFRDDGFSVLLTLDDIVARRHFKRINE